MKGLKLAFVASTPLVTFVTNVILVFEPDMSSISKLLQAGPSRRIAFDHTEDQTWFTDDRLAQYDAVLFLSNTGEGE